MTDTRTYPSIAEITAPLLHDPKIFDFVRDSLKSLAEEEEGFAADEVSALSEDLILALSGLGIQAYLNGPAEDEVFNSQFLEILLGIRKSDSPPALLGRVKKLIHKSALDPKISADPFFQKVKEKLPDMGKTDHPFNLLQSAMIQFRNDLFHGIFIAPPFKNREMTEKVCSALKTTFSDLTPIKELEPGIPVLEGKILFPLFHTSLKGEKGESMTFVQHLAAIDKEYAKQKIFDSIRPVFQKFGGFGKKYEEYLYETSPDFLSDEIAEASKIAQSIAPWTGLSKEIRDGWKNPSEPKYPLLHIRGSHGIGKTALWATLTTDIWNEVKDDPSAIFISYRNREWRQNEIKKELELGVRFSNRFLFDHWNRELKKRVPEWKKKTESSKFLKASFLEQWEELEKFYIAESLANKAVTPPITYILIDDVHYRFSNPNHVLSLSRGLFSMRKYVKFVGLSAFYPFLQYTFGSNINLDANRKGPLDLPSEEKIEEWIEAYIVDRGPSPSEPTEKSAYDELKSTVFELKKLLGSNDIGEFNLHKLAQSRGMALTLLEEAAYILSPVLFYSRVPFEKDDPKGNPLFLNRETEMSFPYHIIRRRDIRIEYQAPVVSRQLSLLKSETKKARL